MTMRKRTKVWMDLSTRAVAAALVAHDTRNPGSYIAKKKLIPAAVARAKQLWEEDYTTEYEIEAIPTPPEYFFTKNWSDICLRLADQNKYLVWESFEGIRLGNFEEYQSTQQKLARICSGIVDNNDKRGKIIIEQGGNSLQITFKTKLLGAGDTSGKEG